MISHPGLTVERWGRFPLGTRLLHIGSELKRLQHWLECGDQEEAQRSLERGLELFDLTVATARPGRQRRELCRAREILRHVLISGNPTSEARMLTRTLIGEW